MIPSPAGCKSADRESFRGQGFQIKKTRSYNKKTGDIPFNTNFLAPFLPYFDFLVSENGVKIFNLYYFF